MAAPPDHLQARPRALFLKLHPRRAVARFQLDADLERVELIYPLVTKDYNLKPVKPVLMAEGAYEAGSEYGFDVTPLWVRRQAYYSYLAGAHHTYGHNDSWRVLPTWKKALDAPGAVQLGISRRSSWHATSGGS